MTTNPSKNAELCIPPIKGIQNTDSFWPPKVVWGREHGWLNVRDPWGQWHSIPTKEAPAGYVKLAMQAKGR